jgi:hypothetical protein
MWGTRVMNERDKDCAVIASESAESSCYGSTAKAQSAA